MGACAADDSSYIEFCSVGVACKYNVAGAVGDAVVGISVKLIKELDHFRVCVLSR